ncbi:MAG: Eco57I restriction-modification methylase domain-containing protein [Mariniphaga sp.]|nr:Eco57I restriction-modification methylase domain-containing protein [Mariniphaga sp.]
MKSFISRKHLVIILYKIVIGNPPYITFKGKEFVNISDYEVKKLIELYPNSAEYKVNSFALFTDRSVNLLTNNGILSFIIPSTILQNEYLKKIRGYLITNYHISQIVSFANKVFEAVTDSIIFFVKNSYSKVLETTAIRKYNLDFSIIEEFKIYTQAKWDDKKNGYVINLKTTNQEDKFLDQIQYQCDFIDDYLEVYVGIVANGIKKFLSTSKLDAKHKKYLQGKHIDNFEIKPDSLFINFLKEQLHSNTDETVYLQKEKILVRKTGNRLIAALDNEQYYTDQSIYNLYPRKTNHANLKIITGLLNSKLLEYYFNKKMITNPDVFPYIKGIHLKKLPLKFPKCKADELKFETIVNYILFLKSQRLIELNDLLMHTYIEQLINGMVYEIYFPELLKKHNREIIKHLGELPKFTDGMSGEQKMKICKKVFGRLNDKEHPVRINLEKMKQEIPEIKIIEGGSDGK